MYLPSIVLRIITVLLLIPAGLSAKDFASYDGQVFPRIDRPDEVLYDLVGQSIEQMALKKDRENNEFKGREFGSLEEYREKEWPRTRQSIDRVRAQMTSFKDLLSSYSQVKDSVTSTAFYNSLSTSSKEMAGVDSIARWENNYANFQSVEEIENKLQSFPETAEEAYKLYGASLDFTAFKQAWVMERLEEIDPKLNRRLSRQAFLDGMTTSSNPYRLTMSEAEKKYEHAKNAIFAELSIRLVMSREMEKITFTDSTDAEKFKKYWRERIPKPIGLGMIPEKTIPVPW